MARLPLLTRDDLPEEHEGLFDVDEGDPDDVHINVHRVWANNPQLLEDWGEWSWALYDAVGDARIRELAILSVARALDSRYVWHQHVEPALAAGVSAEEIVSVSTGDFRHFSTAEAALLEYVTTLVTDVIEDEVHDELERHFGDQVIVAVAFLASEYLQIATMIDALAVELEDEFVGWRLENL